MSQANTKGTGTVVELVPKSIRDGFEAFRCEAIRTICDFTRDQWAQISLVPPPDGEGVDFTETRAADPEALLLTSLEVAREDPEFRLRIGEWVCANHHRLNRQRLTNLCADPRDSELVSKLRIGEWGTEDSEGADMDLLLPVNFAFRMRKLLGLSVRAELLRIMLGASDGPLTMRQLVEYGGFSRRNTARAISSLREAGFVVPQPGIGLMRLSAEPLRWISLLADRRGAIPEFMDWPRYLRGCRELLRWLRSEDCRKPGSEIGFQLVCDDMLFRIRRPFAPYVKAPPTWIGATEYMTEMASYLERALGPIELPA